MARVDEGDALRGCPTCGTKVAEATLGMRDYSRWLADHLPGRVSGADIDLVVEQSRTGRCLMVEFKRKGQILPTGQRLLLTAMAKRNVDVWVAWEDATHVEVGVLSPEGEVYAVEKMTHNAMGRRIRKWWNAGLED